MVATNADTPPRPRGQTPDLGPWVITIPDYTPPSLNVLVGVGVRRRHRAKKGCAELVAAYAHQAGVPRLRPGYAPRRKLTLTLYGWRRGSMPDPDNMLKAVLDGCKRAGLIVDDARGWCEWSRPELVRSATRQTVITIEDC